MATLIWPFFNVYFADRLGATTEIVRVIFVAISAAMAFAQFAGPLVAGIWLARLASSRGIVHYRAFRREDPHPGVRDRLRWPGAWPRTVIMPNYRVS